MNNIFNKKFIGFNLIELMIVLAVLAIITTIAITQYNAYLKKVAISTATSLTDNIKARVMLYYADQEQFPSITNGNATEINNNFNRNALDANTQQNISNVAFYSFSDAATTPALPISVSSHFNSNYKVLGYIQVDFNPSRKLYIDSSAAAQLFLVAFEVNNKISLNQFDENINNTPKLVLASDQELGSTVQWQPFQTNVSVSIPGATQSCPGNQIMRSNRCSLCDAGTYTDINNAMCVPCAAGQYSATPGATQCTACDTGTYSGVTGSSSCTSCGTGVATCNSSNGGAITCIAAGSPASYTLQGSAGQVGTTCRVSCSGSNYANASNGCSSCPANCAACTSDTACSSCSSSVFYGSTCQYQCSPGCTSCTNSSNCSTCNTGSGYRLYNNACYNPCPGGTYANGSICSNCSPGCTSCSNNSNCSTCNTGSGYLLYNNACYNPCPGGTYANGSICSNCSPGCTNCSNNSNCSTCNTGSGYRLYNNACYNPCPGGTYANGGICSNCSPGCTSCSNNSTCSTCNTGSGYHLYNNACYNPCPGGTYANGSICSNCSPGCTSCSNSSNCSTCNNGSGYRLYNNACYNPCPGGTYANGSICSNCPPGCTSCSSNYSCSTCNTGSGYRLYNNACYNPCPGGTYANGSICSNCPPGCTSCSNNSNCSTCNTGSGYHLYNNACYNPCPSGTWAAAGTNTCISCLTTGVATCDPNTGIAVSCITGYTLQGNNCILSCPAGTGLSSSSCVACNSGTWAANGANTCISCLTTGVATCDPNTGSAVSCITGYTLQGNNCTLNCPPNSATNGSGDPTDVSGCRCNSSNPKWGLVYSTLANGAIHSECHLSCPAGYKYCSHSPAFVSLSSVQQPITSMLRYYTGYSGTGYTLNGCTPCTASYCYYTSPTNNPLGGTNNAFGGIVNGIFIQSSTLYVHIDSCD